MRVAGVHRGGMVDRFNRKAEHRLITVGMTLVSISSPYFKKRELKNDTIVEVIKFLHAAAPGTAIKAKSGNEMRKYDGKEVTLGFRVGNRTRKVDTTWLDTNGLLYPHER